MHTSLKYTAVALATLSLVACQQGPNGQQQIGKKEVGTIGGAALGAWAGSAIGKGSGNVVAIAAGTLLGAALGNQIGASLDRADMAYYRQASQEAMETAQPGQTLPWQNPNSAARGTIPPSNYYQTSAGQYCREYQQTITVGGKQSEGYGTACRQPDGSWQIVD